MTSLSTVILSLGMCLTYSAFNGAQNVLVALYGTEGSVSLSIAYLSFSVSGLFLAAGFVDRVGARRSMALGALCYTPLHVVQTVSLPQGYTFLASTILGVGSGILWTAQGHYLAATTTVIDAGHQAGVFLFLFQFSQVIGNITTSWVLDNFSPTELFCVFAIMTAGGAFLMLLCLPEAGTLSPDNEPATFSSVYYLLLEDTDVRRFLPLLFWTGLTQPVFFSYYPSRVVAPRLGVNVVGYVMVSVGLADTFMSLLAGCVADYSATLLLMAALSMLTGSFVAIVVGSGSTSFTALCLVGVCIGTADAALNTFVYYHIGTKLRQKSCTVWGLVNTVQGVVGGVAMLAVPYLSEEEVGISSMMFCGLGILPFLAGETSSTKLKKSKSAGGINRLIEV